MPTRARALAVVAGALALVLASCSSSTESTHNTETGAATTTSTVPAGPVAVTPVLASVVAAPVPVPATDGKIHLAYEVQLTNVLPEEVTLTSVAALAGDQPLLTLSGSALGYWTRIVGSPTPTTKLGPGQTAIVWLDVAMDKSAAVPVNLIHAIGLSIATPQPPLIPGTMTERVAPVAVQTRKPAVIAPPLDGPNWLDGDSCCDMTAHRNALNALNGTLWGAERFAIDYIQIGPGGSMFTGDRSKVESYPYFGADIHAVADGPVVAVLDGLPEQTPGKSPTGLKLDEYGGNHIVQDIGDGNYAFYAHLKTGSLKVKVGDRLTTGQVIASLGNTGNSDGPHLHFHVMSTPDPLRSDGLPFVIDTFRLDSRLQSQDALDPLLQGKQAVLQPGFVARDEKEVSPLVLDVMSYETK